MENLDNFKSTIVNYSIEKQNIALANSLLDIFEQTATPELQRVISSIRVIMQMPDCVELFNTYIIDANGARIPISKDTIHKAFDCLERLKKEEIERLPMPENEKEYQKTIMSAWMQFSESLLVNEFYQRGLLLE